MTDSCHSKGPDRRRDRSRRLCCPEALRLAEGLRGDRPLTSPAGRDFRGAMACRSTSPTLQPAQASLSGLGAITHLVYAAPLRAAGAGRGLAGRGADPHQRPDAAQSSRPLEQAPLAAPRRALHQGARGQRRRPATAGRRARTAGRCAGGRIFTGTRTLPARGTNGQGVELVDPAAGADRRRFRQQRHERDPRPRRLRCDHAARRQDQARLSRRRRPCGAGGRYRPAGARHRLVGRSRRRPRNQIFNVTNGDVFVWPNVWPAIADALGFAPGEHVPLSLDREIRPRKRRGPRSARRMG